MIVSGLPGSELDKGLPGFEEFNKYPRGALEQTKRVTWNLSAPKPIVLD